MDADHPALRPRDLHHLQNGGIVQLDVVSRENLDRTVTQPDQRRQIVVETRNGWIGDRDVKGVVDHRPTSRAGGVVRHGVTQRLALGLCGKGNHAGRAPHRRRPRGRFERVGVHQAHAGHLFDMGMDIDTTGHHQPPGCVDHPISRAKIAPHRHNLTLAHRDLKDLRPGCRHDGSAPDHQIVPVLHLSSPRRDGAPCDPPIARRP